MLQHAHSLKDQQQDAKTSCCSVLSLLLMILRAGLSTAV